MVNTSENTPQSATLPNRQGLFPREDWQGQLDAGDYRRTEYAGTDVPYVEIKDPHDQKPRDHAADFLAAALSSVIRGASYGNGRQIGGLDSLKRSALYNDLASGESLDGDQLSVMQDDKGVQEFLAKDGMKNFLLEDGNTVMELYLNEIAPAYRRGLAMGRELGYIPEEVDEARVNNALQKSTITVVSPTEDGEGWGGYYESTDDGIRLLAGANQAEKKAIITHELTHMLQGGTFQSYIQNIHRTREGFRQRGRHTGLNEAVTEHVAQAIMAGDWETIDPAERPTLDGIRYKAYLSERQLLASFIDKSGGLVDLKTIAKANFEDTGNGSGVEHRRQMMREVRAAYGPGALHKFDELCKFAEMYEDEMSEVERQDLMNCIVGPKFDTTGRVVKKGYIDIPEWDTGGRAA